MLITPDGQIGRGNILIPKSLVGYLGVVGAVIGFAGGVFVFVRVQILQSYPFYNGVFGDKSFFLWLTYTAALEIFGVVAVLGWFLWAYSRSKGGTRTRLAKAFGETSLVFGVLVATVVYLETRVLWGEILPGIHVWGGLPGGGGYPWGTEQVAYNTCFVPSSVRGDCAFLNYNELLLIALLGGLVGFLLLYGGSNELDTVLKNRESFHFSTRFEMFIPRAINWCLDRDAKSRFLEYAKYTQYSDGKLSQEIARDGRRE